MVSRTTKLSVGAALGPLLLSLPYWIFSRWPEIWCTAATEFIAGGLATAAGLVPISLLPLKSPQRYWAAIVYAPIMFVAVMVFGFWTVDTLFGISPYPQR